MQALGPGSSVARAVLKVEQRNAWTPQPQLPTSPFSLDAVSGGTEIYGAWDKLSSCHSSLPEVPAD